MTPRATGRTAALAGAAAALLLLVTPAFARGGGGGGGHGGGGGGGHGGGGHFGGGGHVGGGGHFGGGGHASAPHYSAPSTHGPSGSIRGGSPMRGPAVGYGRGYIGGGRGAYAPGGRVPSFYGGYGGYGGRYGFYGGPRGRVWWGPHYGWRVPGYWGGYYRPYGAYWGASYWVTDWIMLDYLAAEESRRIEYGGPSAVAVPVESPPLNVGVREELRAQVAEILATPAPLGSATPGAGNTLVVTDPRVASALAAPHHVFVVSRAVTVTDRTSGGGCSLTQGDLLRSSAPIPSGQSMGDVTVAASKTGSCSAGATVALPIADLVHFEEGLLERVAKGAAAGQAADSEAEPAPNEPAPTAPGY